MKGYVVTNFTINDRDTFKQYLSRVSDTVNKYEGKFLVRGPIANVIEGEPHKFLAVVEFPSIQIAETWFNSKEYQDIIDMRLASTEGWLVITNQFAP
jgi:uncharacterized protein (DUF1330 family)